MTDVVLFHHVLGLTDGVRELAERLAGGDHRVHTPDLYHGAVAASLEEGFTIKEGIGDDVLAERAERALDDLAPDLVYAGISLGVVTAQRMAQTRPGARGALLYEACLPVTGEWAIGPWPAGVPVQIHGMDDDEFFAHEGDIEAARDWWHRWHRTRVSCSPTGATATSSSTARCRRTTRRPRPSSSSARAPSSTS